VVPATKCEPEEVPERDALDEVKLFPPRGSPDVRALPNDPPVTFEPRPAPEPAPPASVRPVLPDPEPAAGPPAPEPAHVPLSGRTLVTVGLELSSTAVPHAGQNVARSGNSSAQEKHFMPAILTN
jgi:hypothetical protein